MSQDIEVIYIYIYIYILSETRVLLLRRTPATEQLEKQTLTADEQPVHKRER